MKITNDHLVLHTQGSSQANKLLTKYYHDAHRTNEKQRIELASELCTVWKKQCIPFPPPAIPHQLDYWYLVQLFALNRHVTSQGNQYPLCFQKEEIIIPIGCEKMIIKTAKDLSLIPASKNNLLTRNEWDRCLHGTRDIINKAYSVPHSHIISHIPYSLYLQIDLSYLPKQYRHCFVYFDGYRKRNDNSLTSLYGGNAIFSETSYIDSLWSDIPNTSIRPLFVIRRATYV